MENAIFALEKVCYSYPGRPPALADIDLRIEEGESVAILGANGSGKSTLLMLLDALFFPVAGKVAAFGQELRPDLLDNEAFRAEFRSAVALVFQNSDAQLFCPTVREELAFGPLQLGVDSARTDGRTTRLLDRLGIAKLAERAPYQLSAGEKKRVAIAAALSVEPKVLLLDEPTAALDPRSTRVLLDIALEFREAGGTLVLATHDLHILSEAAQRICVLDETGRMAASGPVAAILSDDALLRRHNLSHIHRHQHGGHWHDHVHGHGGSADQQ